MIDDLLQATGLTVEFGGLKALDGVDVTVSDGEIVALVGPNGSGKTTFLNAVMGYLPTTGEVSFCGHTFGRELPHERIAHGMARSFQHVDMYERLKVADVMGLGFYPTNKQSMLGTLLRLPSFRQSEREIANAAEELLDDLGVDTRIVRSAFGSLPYGTRKMVDVARAVASRPRLVFLDEPSSGVSADERAEIQRLILAVRDRGTSVVVIEHNMGIVREVADRVIALNFGQKITDGTFDEVWENELLREVYFDV